ncbi:ParB/Srx family N-terminal domain-containing protein [Vibrio mediterranei]|uniref:ParB-like N-terminal domain-containing protein n=1 Tax=Vibrio mediterranei TaxID=689 RepID=A0ABX5D533_9VIBR|nr:ParB/Srx family N-terminal domain-containing protein [Vibrio mediterranei]PCD85276.1 hypothetical protein COR52_27590 [Vibrio mediterranei]PRQ64794.1 hypothetical protein COR51_25780 [Vibrio mediterranei]
MNAKTQAQTHSVQETTTNVSTLDPQATAQNDNSSLRLPIRVLVESDLNVRKTKATKEQDAELKASIAAHGLIQNLVCLPEDSGVYGVVAGGRRLTQLKALVNDGLLSLDDVVPVKVLTDSEAKDYAQQMSLTENLTRAAMHPADEFEAFCDMIGKGATVEAVAQHFGTTIIKSATCLKKPPLNLRTYWLSLLAKKRMNKPEVRLRLICFPRKFTLKTAP